MANNTTDIRSTRNTFTQKNTFNYGTIVTETSTSGTINLLTGGLVATGNIKGGKVYNAVWNDLVDCIPVDPDCPLEFGKCYCFNGETYTQTSEYMQGNIIGIHSDTSGFEMGHKLNTRELFIAVAGFVLAYVDKEYPVGTPLTCISRGFLTKLLDEDKRKYPERIVALYWKPENDRLWGNENHKVLVKGRHWVKVRR